MRELEHHLRYICWDDEHEKKTEVLGSYSLDDDDSSDFLKGPSNKKLEMDNKTPKSDNDPVELIRGKLNKDRVKLWQAPYSTDNGEKGEAPEELINQYASDLGLEPTVVASVLEQLRVHSLEKLAARRRRSETGVLNLKVKMAGKMTVEKAEFEFEVSPFTNGQELREQISNSSGIPVNRLKLIGCGHVIMDDKSLYEQHVRPDSHIMAVILSETEAAAQAKEAERKRLEDARKDAEILSNQSWGDDTDGDYYLQIADQSGKPVTLPVPERKALALAMTLHEQGRAAIRRKEYPYALLLLLEADEEFSKCNSGILSSVDNYALLCLDVCWCYLCLQCVNELPDADSRLKKCEECLTKSYGKNLERLQALKGSVANEQALLMRLHLLQAIVSFHVQDYNKALNLIKLTEQELNDLHVDDEKLSQVMAMGYHATEARLALRNSRGDIQMAVSLIIQRREEKIERQRKEEEQRKKRKQEKRLGKTINGDWVNFDLFKMVLAMGYSHHAAKESLKQSNNNVSLAVQFLQENPELLQLAGPSGRITDVEITQVASVGFDPVVAEQALRRVSGDVQKAINLLVVNNGVLPSPSSSEESSVSNSAGMRDNEADSFMDLSEKSPEVILKELEALERLRQDIPEDEEAHLDLTLEEERQFLDEYKIKIMELMV